MPSFYDFSNSEVVQQLKEVLAAMQIKDADAFRIRAYDNAVTALDNLTVSIKDVWEDDRLNQIPGIGSSLAQHLNELFTKGRVSEWEKVKENLPEGMFGLIGLRGVGAKKAYKLASEFQLNSKETAIEELKDYAEKQEIRDLSGFGDKSEKDILEAIEQSKMTKSEKPRMLLIRAEIIAERIKKHMNLLDCIEKMEVLGSFRRRNPTVGDLDFAVATTKTKEVIDHFLEFPEISEILAQGENKVMVVLSNDTQVDLRVSSPEAYGAMLQYNTGNVQHNIILRTHALEKGLSLSEYGIKDKKTNKIKEFATEEEFYEYLGLQYIPPELRYGHNEIELARENKIPKLIDVSDIKGDLHTHTVYSDGLNSVSEMAETALSLGYEYYGITDHSPSIQSRGRDEVEKLISSQKAEIESFNKSQNKLRVLFGYELNILVSNKLSLPDDILKELDIVVAGVHSSFEQDKNTMTKRLISAIENEYVHIIAHPLNRLINERKAVDLNWNKVFDSIKENNKVLEINSQPNRLDLSDDLVREAAQKGIKMIIDTDAHQTSQLLYMRYGVDVARRGWCERKHILNTLPRSDFLKELGIK
ncbi:DNA polymerase/3'-5' exonuclease PolX [Patescibacteria group bacterium]|nr:DNA polymerase/3'-5' exonuclease PolX [Patescibacteria group bacterium]